MKCNREVYVKTFKESLFKFPYKNERGTFEPLIANTKTIYQNRLFQDTIMPTQLPVYRLFSSVKVKTIPLSI